jgi:hypothetical protein
MDCLFVSESELRELEFRATETSFQTKRPTRLSLHAARQKAPVTILAALATLPGPKPRFGYSLLSDLIVAAASFRNLTLAADLVPCFSAFIR